MITREMKREVTILGVLGATKAFVLRLILAESFSLPMIGSFAGIGGAVIVLLGFQNFIAATLDIPFSIPSVQVTVFAAGSALLVMLLLSTVASLYPTIRILNSGLP
jgi:ABC-type lipoprotein release transport system permease subunit